MKNKILCPSMMCADFARIQEEMRLLEEAQIDIYHCDVMDGNFVENMALAINDIQCIRKLSRSFEALTHKQHIRQANKREMTAQRIEYIETFLST